MVEKICENIYRIPIVLPDNPLQELNSYVITGGEKCLLIDTGFDLPACRQAMDKGLKELGLRPADLDIFLTHGHPDHVGLVGHLLERDTKVYISRADAQLEHLMCGAQSREDLYNILFRFGFPEDYCQALSRVWSRARREEFLPARHLVLLEDGDRIEAGGYTFSCVLTPGHTPGHICLWEEREKILFSGDHVLFDITPNIECWKTPCDVLDNYISSLEKIDKLDAKLVLPGHRKPGDLHVRVGELIKHHDDRLLECLRVILDNPGFTAYEIASLLSWKFREKEWDMAPLGQKRFALGECISHIGYLMEKDNVYMLTSDDGKFHYYCQ